MSNRDEYDPEAGTIIPRLASCKSADEVTQVVHEEFLRWFDEDTVGTRERYEHVSSQIWELWEKFNEAIR